jgi:hypothetical protein
MLVKTAKRMTNASYTSVYKSINQVNHSNPFAHIKTLKTDEIQSSARLHIHFISKPATAVPRKLRSSIEDIGFLLGMEIFDSFFRKQRRSP